MARRGHPPGMSLWFYWQLPYVRYCMNMKRGDLNKKAVYASLVFCINSPPEAALVLLQFPSHRSLPSQRLPRYHT